jgi:glycosyltransferase involved in cell wall biosynthesis
MQVWEARDADKVRVVTRQLRDLLVDAGVPHNKIVHIGNATDILNFQPIDRQVCRRKLGLGPNDRVVAFVGNLWPAVDLKVAFFALRRLARDGIKVTFLVVGDGVSRPSFEALGREILGTQQDVRWLGVLQPAAVNEVVNAADVAIAPFVARRNEKTGLSPLKLRDYAAAGTPCVATAISGITNLEGEPWIRLAPPGDDEAFADAIKGFLLADTTSIRRKARDYAVANFDWSSVAEQVAAELSS